MGRKAKTTNKISTSQDIIEQSEEAIILAEANPNQEEEPEISVFRPDREGVRKVLGDLEADIMEFIWEKVPAANPTGITVREVYEAFWQGRYVAYTTIMTTMARLARKHLLRARKVEAAYVYTPILTKEAFIDNFVSRILENLLVSFSYTTETHLQRLANNEAGAERIEVLKARVAALRPQQANITHEPGTQDK